MWTVLSGSRTSRIDCSSVRTLQSIDAPNEILVGDLILLEVLQGARDDRHAEQIERNLRMFEMARMLDETIAVLAAANYRLLREKGVTIRKTIDVVIATFCLVGDHRLLHDDRDFAPFVEHLGLKTL